MGVVLQSFATLVGNAAAGVQGAAAALLDITVGSVLRALLEAGASVSLWLQYALLQVLALARLSTSSGSDVDSWVADFGLTRLPGIAATGSVTFTSFNPGGGSSTIPTGALVRTSAGVSYVVTGGPYTRPQGDASVAATVQCVTAGSSGNVVAGGITLLGSAIANIDTVTNPLAFTNATDPETDAALRARFVTFINTRSEGTPAAIAAAISGVQVGLSYDIAEGVDTTGAPRPGNFVVYLDDGSGSPPASLLTAVAVAIDAVRPIGSTFSVQPPSVVTATVSMTIAVNAATVLGSAQANVAAAIAAYIGGLGLGTKLAYSRLTGLAYAADPGVVDVTGVLLDGGTADLGGGVSQVVRAGTITVGP